MSRRHEREMVVDNFAGGGGASLGIKRVLGHDPDLSINHDEVAVAMHRANHPNTHHYTEDIWKIDPIWATRGRPVGLAWFSPDCTHYSKARGSKPVSERIRGLAWVVIRWAREVKPRVIVLENVEEFKTWGPVIKRNGERFPCPRRKGKTFLRWYQQLEQAGYDIEMRELRGCDYGAPTIRKRLFIVARCDGAPIVWPEPTHASPADIERGAARKPYRSAAECIDWSLPCPSIFMTKQEAKRYGDEVGKRVNRPLAENTMRRIANGVKRYVIDARKPFIVRSGHYSNVTGAGASFRGQLLDLPLSTVCSVNDKALVAPFLSSCAYSRTTGRGRYVYPLADPVRTLTGSNDKCLVAPYLMGAGGPAWQGEPRWICHPFPTVLSKSCLCLSAPLLVQVNHGRDANRSRSLLEPLTTVTQRHGYGLVVPTITTYYGPGGGIYRGQDLGEPLRTQTATGNRFALVAAFLSKQNFGDKPCSGAAEPLHTITTQGNRHCLAAAYMARLGQTGGNGYYCNSLADPLTTITSKNEHLLCMAHVSQLYGGSVGQGLGFPLCTVTARNHSALVAAHVVKHFGGMVGCPVETPFATITARGTQNQLVASHLIKLYGTCRHGQDLWTPMPTVTANGNHVAEVRAFLTKYFGTAVGQRCDDPLHSITAKPRFGLVTVEGEDYVIADIGMRMLVPRELYRAQGFPDSYVIDPSLDGKPLSLTAQVKMCGNSVCPQLAEALVGANYQPRRVRKKGTPSRRPSRRMVREEVS